MNETLLVELLSDATADPPPSRVVDLARARAEGARALRRRRAGTAAVCGVATLALIAGAGAAASISRPGQLDPGPGSTSAVGPQNPTPGAGPTATTGPPVAPDRFDVRRLIVTAGWLPDGLTSMRAESTEVEQRLTHEADPGPDGVVGASVTITFYAAGQDPIRPVSGEPGPSVAGAQSTWDARNATLGELAWHWAPDAWATVIAHGFDDLQSVAVRVAENLQLDADRPVLMPYTVTAPPAPLRLVRTLVARYGDGGYEGQLVFSDRDDMIDPDTNIPRMLVIAVLTNESLTGDARVGAPNTAIDGRPAVVEFDQDAGRVLIMGVSGHWVSVYVYDSVTASYVDEDAAVELARSVALVDTPSDPTTWTSSPIR